MRMGEEAETNEIVRFGLDGTEYEVVLPRSHASELRKELAPYLDRARRAGPSLRAT